jgi:hypothetical protein
MLKEKANLAGLDNSNGKVAIAFDLLFTSSLLNAAQDLPSINP